MGIKKGEDVLVVLFIVHCVIWTRHPCLFFKLREIAFHSHPGSGEIYLFRFRYYPSETSDLALFILLASSSSPRPISTNSLFFLNLPSSFLLSCFPSPSIIFLSIALYSTSLCFGIE